MVILAGVLAKKAKEDLEMPEQGGGDPGKTDLDLNFKIDGKAKTKGATDGGKAGIDAVKGAAGGGGAGGGGAGAGGAGGQRGR